MSLTDARAALVAAFTGASLLDPTVISWENVSFNTPSTGPWIKCAFMPGKSVPTTLGRQGQDRVNGIFQIDLNYPEGNGEADAAAMYESIRTLFWAGLRLTNNGQVVVIMACSRIQGRIVNNFYKISVTVEFYTFLNR